MLSQQTVTVKADFTESNGHKMQRCTNQEKKRKASEM